MSKEVIATNSSGTVRAGEIVQEFHFWAKLMFVDEAPLEKCRYPSQTSRLEQRHGRQQNNGERVGWQSLTSSTVHPPTVELMD